MVASGEKGSLQRRMEVKSVVGWSTIDEASMKLAEGMDRSYDFIAGAASTVLRPSLDQLRSPRRIGEEGGRYGESMGAWEAAELVD